MIDGYILHVLCKIYIQTTCLDNRFCSKTDIFYRLHITRKLHEYDEKKPVQFSNYIYITLFKTKIILPLKLKNKCTNDLRCLRQFFRIHMLFLSLVKLQRNSSGRFFNRSLSHAVYPVEIIMKILICLNVTK